MLFGIRDGCLKLGAVEALPLAAKLGFDGIEICIGQDTSVNPLWQDGGIDQVKAAMESSGAVVSSLSPGYFASCHPVVDDPALRQHGHNLMLECIERCAPVGAGYLLVPMFPKDMDDWADEKWQALIDGFQPLAQAAADAGVLLCLETTFSADHLDRIIDGVGNDAFKVYYDTANTTNLGYHSPTEIRQLGAKIGAIHVKDTDNQHLGDGRVPWAGCSRACSDIEYDGWLVLETPAGDDPAISAARNYGFTRCWSVWRGGGRCQTM